jgi:hypothetical protein
VVSRGSCGTPLPALQLCPYGLLGAALIFPQGVEGDHGYMYLALAVILNFGLFFAMTYYLFGLFSKPKTSN